MDIVYNFLENEIKLNKEDTIVVGVSAGPDSMALLYILDILRKKIGFKIIVAHINHNIRCESKEEEEFLKEYCLKNHFFFESMTIKKYGDDNFHNEARTIRYHFYEELITKYGANYLMTGHHGDDLIETIMMRLVRGSTMHGYSGFSKVYKMKNYTIVRPLIFVTKEEIIAFNEKNSIPYRIDNSNFKDKYTRNRYRKNILPFLKNEDVNVHHKFLKFSEMLMEYDDYINKVAKKEITKVYKNNYIDIELFKKCEKVIQRKIVDYIFGLLYEDDINCVDDKHFLLVINAINSKKASLTYDLPNDFQIVKEYNKVYIKKSVDSLLAYDIELCDEVYLANGMKIVKVASCETNGNDVMRIKSSDVVLPLHIRTRRCGDRMEVMNMKGSKKVSDIFVNAKIPVSKRDTWPIVVDAENKIIWIPNVKKSKYNRRKNEECDIIFKCC